MQISQQQQKTLSLSPGGWKIVQLLLWIVGVIIVGLLLFRPAVGIALFWNLLIPLAPAIVVLLPGVWRNICPLSSTAIQPGKSGLSKQIKLSIPHQGNLYFIGVVALWLIVPLRHLSLNLNGPATAAMLLTAAAVALIMGLIFESRSGWCTTLCPIHSVERLYGTVPVVTTENAHCSSCQQCVSLCPDSTPQMTADHTRNITSERIAGLLMTGGFVGFIWGWNQVADHRSTTDFATVVTAYAWPLLSGLASIAVYVLLKKNLDIKQTQILNRVFATAAVACYYWYRIPSLVGMGLYPDDGVLIDLSHSLPVWFPLASKLITTAFFFWFMLIRPIKKQKQSWTIRPPYAIDIKIL